MHPGFQTRHYCCQDNPASLKYQSMGVDISYCSQLCYSHPLYGVAVVPTSIWKAAQQAEGKNWVWHGKLGWVGDRYKDHFQGFQRYSCLPEALGHVIEFGMCPASDSQSSEGWVLCAQVLDLGHSFEGCWPCDPMRRCLVSRHSNLELAFTSTTFSHVHIRLGGSRNCRKTRAEIAGVAVMGSKGHVHGVALARAADSDGTTRVAVAMGRLV